MKKLLGIFGFGLLFILIDLVTPTKVEACHYGWMVPKSSHSTFELLKCKAESAIDDVNPLNYFKNKKMCQAYADRADTVAIGKRRYKDCMKDPDYYR
jgi:hypothetical protein